MTGYDRGRFSVMILVLLREVIALPRAAREKSASGIYHIMLRGVNHRQIFFDEEDYQYFIQVLKRFKAVSGYEIYAYCLMGNHVHLLFKEGKEDIGIVFRRIGTTFAFWYNTKYDRVGHIFQDRFRSEPVETRGYLFAVLRYILRNPVAAGFCSVPDAYPYSSAEEYFNGAEGITDTTFISEMIDSESLREYVMQNNDDTCMDIETSRRRGVTDEEAKRIIIEEFGTLSPDPDGSRNRAAFKESVKNLYNKGISVRQLSRITGISRGILQ